MHTTNLRKVGGSVMMAVPPTLLELLHLQAGTKVTMAVDNGRLIVEAQIRPHYHLAELLAESDYSPESADEREWIDAPAVGREII